MNSGGRIGWVKSTAAILTLELGLPQQFDLNPAPELEDPRVFYLEPRLKSQGGLLFGGGSSIWIRENDRKNFFAPSARVYFLWYMGPYM